VFAGAGGTLMGVSASGGKCEVLSAPNRQRGELARRRPQILPGGRSLLFTIGGAESYDSARIAVLDLANGSERVLVNGATAAP
jgi:hypothetical protein